MFLRQSFHDILMLLSGETNVRQAVRWLNSSRHDRSTPNKKTNKNRNGKRRDSSVISKVRPLKYSSKTFNKQVCWL